jgi:hypothetical protein
VLSHQAIIDSAWEDSIKPLLLKRSPSASIEQLREARAHAYGGCIIQDMGYYPFGNKFFTDLTHYVRSGDFIEALIAEAADLNEYAFALGALAHYASDSDGHAIGTNRAVPIIFPDLRAKYGSTVTYAHKPSAHIRAEFGFDVLQVARGRYAPQSYHDFIGFKVSKPVLERAFKRTYSIDMKDIFANLDLALGSYRRAVSTVIPELTRVAWETKKDEIEKLAPGITRDRFIYRLSRSEYEKEWGADYEKPGILTKTLAFFIRIVPKVGPLKVLKFKAPPPEAEHIFVQSFDAALGRYKALLGQVRSGRVEFQDRDFDTGQPTRPGEYALADKTHAKLLQRLAKRNFEGVSRELKQNLLAFFSDRDAPNAIKKDKDDWAETMRALEQLRAVANTERRTGQR